jgi:hypothetical protein
MILMTRAEWSRGRAKPNRASIDDVFNSPQTAREACLCQRIAADSQAVFVSQVGKRHLSDLLPALEIQLSEELVDRCESA